MLAPPCFTSFENIPVFAMLENTFRNFSGLPAKTQKYCRFCHGPEMGHPSVRRLCPRSKKTENSSLCPFSWVPGNPGCPGGGSRREALSWRRVAMGLSLPRERRRQRASRGNTHADHRKKRCRISGIFRKINPSQRVFLSVLFWPTSNFLVFFAVKRFKKKIAIYK